MVFSLLLFFILGLSFGSFLNVLVFRYHTGLSLGGRSQCFTCGKALRWYELVPVFSFCLQRGRCRRCGAKISFQYPLVEFLTGMLFVAVYVQSGNRVLLVLDLAAWSLLMAMAVYDIRHTIIPDGFVAPFIVLGLLRVFLFAYSGPSFFFDLAAGPVIALPFFIIWLASKGRLMGLGDIKLMLGLGWLLGAAEGLSAVILAFWIAAAAALGVMAFSRIMSGRHLFVRTGGLTMKSEVPFGPFLVIGAALVFFCNIHVLTLPF